MDYFEAIGEAAFYGPKLDVEVKTAIGHEVTLSTCQLDFLLPEKFDLTYVDKDGSKKRPVVLHRAILGTIDRFMAFLIEETKGVFPVWLAPTQVNIIPVNIEYHLEYAQELKNWLESNHIRVELDERNEKLGYKMRDSQTRKIPITLIIGNQEIENQTISYRIHGSEETHTLGKEEFLNHLNEVITKKVLHQELY